MCLSLRIVAYLGDHLQDRHELARQLMRWILGATMPPTGQGLLGKDDTQIENNIRVKSHC